jgi:8-oxo-dGTP diphosphatase
VILVRHASAGDASEWPGRDDARPLDDRGRRQADALVDALASLRVERVLSSPYIRCLQTVEPLAAARGLAVELRQELHEDAQSTAGVELVRSVAGDPVVVCGHGGLAEAALGEEHALGKAMALVVDFGPRVLVRLEAAALA